jgi:hypothetical protein
MRVALLPTVALACAACLEFEDPVIPDRHTAAVLQANMRIFDTGTFQVDGTLSPGRESSGFLRVVQIPFIQSGPYVIAPKTLDERGVRRYQESFPVERGATEGPFELVPPDVRGAEQLPPVRWWGLRRIGSDTIIVPPGADIVLRLDTVPAPSQPANRGRQWFLDIRTGPTVFRISGDGPPPLTLRIPTEFAPGALGGRTDIGLIYFQSAQIRATDNSYIANIVLDTRLSWVVLFRDPE